MGRMVFMGTSGAVNSTNAALPFVMAAAAAESGREAAVILMNEGVDLMNPAVRDTLVPFGWPPFRELLEKVRDHGVPIYV